jgi:hypothetical protein
MNYRIISKKFACCGDDCCSKDESSTAKKS